MLTVLPVKHSSDVPPFDLPPELITAALSFAFNMEFRQP